MTLEQILHERRSVEDVDNCLDLANRLFGKWYPYFESVDEDISDAL